MTTVILHVPGISCEHCERAVTHALSSLPGVRSVTVDVPAKQVRVAYDETRIDLNRMKEVLQDEDYPVASVTSGS
jgi:copper chaperone